MVLTGVLSLLTLPALLMKFFQKALGVHQVLSWFPCIFAVVVILPLDQIFDSSFMVACVEYLLCFVFFFFYFYVVSSCILRFYVLCVFE